MDDFEQVRGALINPRMVIAPDVTIGAFSIIGVPDSSGQVGTIESGSSIGSYCHIALSSILRRSVDVDHYARIGEFTEIGEGSRILYNARIFRKVKIGKQCIISGDIPNRVVIGDHVTFMGEIAHTYRDPTIRWDTVEEPSPIIYARSVVGVRALLIGPVEIGPRSYVAAGEIVRHNIPPDSVFFKGQLTPLSAWKGLIKVREDLDQNEV